MLQYNLLILDPSEVRKLICKSYPSTINVFFIFIWRYDALDVLCLKVELSSLCEAAILDITFMTAVCL